MNRLHAGTIGSDTPSWATTPEVPEPWPQLLAAWQPHGLRSVQREALIPLLADTQHLVICAPTNSGKSFCAHLELVRCCLAGQRAVLVEPMRVLATEQARSLEATIERLSPLLARLPTVRLSTGEFRHNNEFQSDRPPEDGEILVVTPERLDLILRNPMNDDFVASIGSVVVDEAHLLFDEGRGSTLEGVLTSLLLLSEAAKRVAPRLVLLSATLPEPERICRWLGAELISTQDRYPSLTTWVEAADDQADANRRIGQECASTLLDASSATLVFVYRTRDAASLAKVLGTQLGQQVGFVHSQMSSAAKGRAIEAFTGGQSRVLVASSALAMGVNLPSTHVIVRDTHYPGVGPVPIHQLRQMCGRAGRGDLPGQALILVQSNDPRGAVGLAELLSSTEQAPAYRRRRTADDMAAPVFADRIASVMLRFHDRGVDLDFLRMWYERSLGGAEWTNRIPSALDWMSWWRLASNEHAEYHDARWRLTLGGKAAATHGLPLRVAAGALQLWRDLLELDDRDQLLSDWTGLDHLILLELLADRSPSLRPESGDLADGIHGWMERNVAMSPSMLWREWLHLGDQKAREVLGSLGIQNHNKPLTDDTAGRIVRQALLRAIVLSERMRGASTEQLARQWRLSSFDGVEEGLRDHRIWLSHGIAQLADWPVLSWHCNHQLRIDDVRKERVKNALRGLRFHALSCCGSLSTCSPLGALLPGLRQQSGKTKVGIGTLRTLERAGIGDLASLVRMTQAQLIAAGVRRDLAIEIDRYCRSVLR
jgi:helicase